MEVIHKSDWLQITNKAEKTVEIDITGIIGGSFWDEDNPDSKNTADKMRAELKAVAEIKAEKIIINIDSPGGLVSHGLSIHDLLAQHLAQKETRVIGMTASIATVIMQVGHVRKMSDNSLILLHRSGLGLMGIFNTNDLAIVEDALRVVDNKIINIYEKRSGKTTDEIKTIIDSNSGQGKWMDSKEAKEFGMIDETFEPTKAVAYDSELFNKLKYPKLPDMSEKTIEVRSFFDKIKDAFVAAFKVEGKDEIPQEVTDKLTEFGNKLTELETENESLSAELTASISLNEALLIEQDVKIQELTAQIAVKQTELDAKESQINQLNAKSTKIPGKVGAEGVDEGVVFTELEMSLQQDLKKLRSEMSAVRAD